MAVSKEGKEHCIHNLVTEVIDSLSEYFPNIPINNLMFEFTKSNTYALLCNIKTGMWMEGPDYILDWYIKEKGISLPLNNK